MENSYLFDGINREDIESVLKCLGAKHEKFQKNQYILKAGDSTQDIGILISGNALIIQEDFWGNRNILAKLSKSDLFADTFAILPDAVMTVAVVAQEECVILWLKVGRILNPCQSACTYHSRLIRNLVTVLASKNLLLSEKLTHMAQRTTREKMLSYLSSQANKHQSNDFYIAFNRQQLADYLSVERSALSFELSKLRNEGYIKFSKNHFILNRSFSD